MDNQPVPTPQPPAAPATILPQEPTKSYKRNWKKWITVYIIIGAILYIGIYYLILSPQSLNYPKSTKDTCPLMDCQYGCKDGKCLSPSPDPTASWKTYTNTKYDYQFKYPPIFFIRELDDPSSGQVIFVTSFDTKNDPIPEGIASDMQINISKGNTIAEDLARARSLFQNPIEEDILIDKITGKKVSGNGTGMVEDKFFVFTYVFKNNYTFQFNYTSGDSKFSKELYDQILSTLQFLD